MKRIVASLAAVLAGMAAPAAQADWASWNPVALYSTVQELRARHQMPGLDAHGVTLPQALLFDKLRAAVNGPGQAVESLTLQNGAGTLVVLAHAAIDVRLTVHFRVQRIDWTHRTVWLWFDESARSASPNLLGSLFGNLMITTLEAATGREHVKTALSGMPYFQVSGNLMGIRLDQIPALKDTLAMDVAGVKVFDHVGLTNLAIEDGRLRVALGLPG